ncbi:MAG: McrC family protein [Bradymonadaceae bacterium]
MTAHLAIREYEKVYLGAKPTKTGSREAGRLMISPKHYKWLERFDENHADGEGRQIFDWRRRWFRPKNWVGVVQVGDLTVEILPKIDTREEEDGDAEQAIQFSRANLLYMLSLSGDVPLRERDVASQALRKAPISETLIALFADRLMQELVRGRHHAYVTQRENLKVLRGKLLFSQHLKQNVARKDRFFVEHDDFLPDTLINQIFKSACAKLRNVTRRVATEEKLGYCLMALHEVSHREIQLEDFERVIENRQNERFAEPLRFCQMILTGNAPTARAGGVKTFALLFNMNEVFERFVAAFMRRHVIREADFPDATVHAQSRGIKRHLLWRSGTDTGRELRLKPDIVIQDHDGYVVLDTKWKRLNGGKSYRQGVTGADLYQLFAYAHRYKAGQSVLLYPWVEGAQPRIMQVPDTSQTVHVRFVRLDRDLGSRAGREALAEELRGMLGVLEISGASQVNS